MMTSVALLPLVGCLFLLGLSLCERNGHLENTIPEATDKCYFNSCVHDFFGGTFIYDVRGPNGFHLNGETEATPHRPYHTGETLTKNYTYHLPPFVKDGVSFRGNLSLINDEGQLLACVHAFCKIAPGTGH
ncbi:uncharacterized protein [Apostichopus japonicus]|uniref:uncharacterized protein isoform X2 n=1 Tax=Stichopus japonicus TaxID=307972 RepID=UPI003AB82ED1